MSKYIIFIFLILINFYTFGDFQLLGRSTSYDSFKIPVGSYLNNTSPVISDSGKEAFVIKYLSSFDGRQGLVYDGTLIHIAKKGEYISRPRFSTYKKSELILFSLYNETSSQGIFAYDIHLKSIQHLIKSEEFTDAYSFLDFGIIKNQLLVFKMKTFENAFLISKDLATGQTLTIIDQNNNFMSYLFSVSYADDYFCLKIRKGNKGEYSESRPDQIIVSDGLKTLLAISDKDDDKSSIFDSFQNSVDCSNQDLVFTASVKEKKSIYKMNFHSKKLDLLAIEGDDYISEIEYFSPVINSVSHVAFRAISQSNKRGIWFYDNKLKLVISEGDHLPTDREMGRVLLRKGFPGFSGNIDINSKGEVIFHTLLNTKYDEEELGAAIYKWKLD